MKNQMKTIRNIVLFSLFIFAIVSNLSAKKIQCVWIGIEKIIAVGDIHGDYNNFVKILKGTGLIDENLHWTGGKTHLVQTGDIMDRGPDAKKAFDLMMRLEEEAEAAGGKVHMLIGNHEEINITGIALDYPDYVSPEQFVSFLPEKYREKKEKKLIKKIGEQTSEETNSDFSLSSYLKIYWQEVIDKERSRRDGEARIKYTNNFNDQYGRWILEHNAVIKINDIIFVHGGISKKYSTWKLENINNLLRNELDSCRLSLKRFQPQKSLHDVVYKTDSPLWYRGLSLEDEKVFEPELEQILKNLKAKYMVIAHTPRIGSPMASNELMSRFQERIWIIDTSISDYISGGFPSALIIENGKFTVWGTTDEQ